MVSHPAESTCPLISSGGVRSSNLAEQVCAAAARKQPLNYMAWTHRAWAATHSGDQQRSLSKALAETLPLAKTQARAPSQVVHIGACLSGHKVVSCDTLSTHAQAGDSALGHFRATMIDRLRLRQGTETDEGRRQVRPTLTRAKLVTID